MTERACAIELYANTRATVPVRRTVTWAEFLADIVGNKHSLATNKFLDAPMFSPVVPKDPAQTRGNANVKALSMAVFDIDHATPPEVEALQHRLEGFRCVVWTTYSFDPASGVWRLRVVLWLSRDVTAEEWPLFWAALVAKFDLPADVSCKDLARLSGLNASPSPETGIISSQDGASVDVDEVLAGVLVPAPMIETPQDPSVTNGDGLRRLDELGRLLQPSCGTPIRRHEASGRPLDKYPICPWSENHSNGQTDGFFAGIATNGSLYAKCKHDGCTGKGLKDLREQFGAEDINKIWGPREQVTVGTDLARMADSTEQILRSVPDIDMYQRGGKRAQIAEQQDILPGGALATTTVIENITQPQMLDLISRYVDYRRPPNADGEKTRVGVPKELPGILVSRGGRGLRPLMGGRNFPLMRPDGSIVTANGYDESTGILFANMPTLGAFATTRKQALAAVAKLLEIISDFPFHSAADRSVWLAALLTPFVRHAIPEASPMFMPSGNQPAAGKTKTLDAIGEIVTGSQLKHTPGQPKEDEMRKQLLAIAKQNATFTLLDNFADGSSIASASLEAFMTSTVWSDRTLGKTAMPSYPVTTTMMLTGNNLRIVGALLRRILPYRLASPLDRPEERSDFRFPDLLRHVKQNRATYLHAALSILHAYRCEGSPTERLKSFGSYEEWSRVVRQPIVWLDLPDPLDVKANLINDDEDADDREALVHGWAELHGRNREGVTARFAHEALRKAAPNEFTLLKAGLAAFAKDSQAGVLPEAKEIGNILRRHHQTPANGLWLDHSNDAKEKTNEGWRWFATKPVQQ